MKIMFLLVALQILTNKLFRLNFNQNASKIFCYCSPADNQNPTNKIGVCSSVDNRNKRYFLRNRTNSTHIPDDATIKEIKKTLTKSCKKLKRIKFEIFKEYYLEKYDNDKRIDPNFTENLIEDCFSIYEKKQSKTNSTDVQTKTNIRDHITNRKRKNYEINSTDVQKKPLIKKFSVNDKKKQRKERSADVQNEILFKGYDIILNPDYILIALTKIKNDFIATSNTTGNSENKIRILGIKENFLWLKKKLILFIKTQADEINFNYNNLSQSIKNFEKNFIENVNNIDFNNPSDIIENNLFALIFKLEFYNENQKKLQSNINKNSIENLQNNFEKLTISLEPSEKINEKAEIVENNLEKSAISLEPSKKINEKAEIVENNLKKLEFSLEPIKNNFEKAEIEESNKVNQNPVYKEKTSIEHLMYKIEYKVLQEAYKFYSHFTYKQIILNDTYSKKNNQSSHNENEFIHLDQEKFIYNEGNNDNLELMNESLKANKICLKNTNLSLFETIVINNKTYYTNDIMFCEYIKKSEFINKCRFRKFNYRYYVKKYFNIKEVAVKAINSDTNKIFLNYCFDIKKLIKIAERIPVDTILNDVSNWNIVYKKINELFRSQKLSIGYVFPEILFFQSFSGKEKLEEIVNKKTFNISHVSYFLHVLEMIFNNDWAQHLKDIRNDSKLSAEEYNTSQKEARLKNKIKNKIKMDFENEMDFANENNLGSEIENENETKIGLKNKIDYENKINLESDIKNRKKKFDAFLYTYVTTYKILEIILHPFLTESDFNAFLKIAVVVRTKCKAVFLNTEQLNLSDHLFIQKNISSFFLKNIIFISPFRETFNINNLFLPETQKFIYQRDSNWDLENSDSFDIMAIINSLDLKLLNKNINFMFDFEAISNYVIFFHVNLFFFGIKNYYDIKENCYYENFKFHLFKFYLITFFEENIPHEIINEYSEILVAQLTFLQTSRSEIILEKIK
ncbi:hypothetical protein GVAV_000471 [Gurleya vavrai]